MTFAGTGRQVRTIHIDDRCFREALMQTYLTTCPSQNQQPKATGPPANRRYDLSSHHPDIRSRA
ncbi:hypothetical protein HMPREF9582_00373 [Cutibacterium acnes HL060PA1]|nr:hypothetical protein HMPREF9582_00373 [Cutibacterium acnes HL060PA1]